jgi:KaiC/GvpD/RAD55 family RecA-like ATPase
METAPDRGTTPVPHDHVVQFYEDERFLADRVAAFLAAGLREGQPAIVIATESHRRAFLRNLKKQQVVDVEQATLSGQLTCLDARETLQGFMVDGVPDAALAKRQLGEVLERIQAANPGKRMRAYGEMVDLLWRDNNAQAAIQLEELWNELTGTYRFSLMCAYDLTTFSRSTSGMGVRDVCDVHTHALPAESYDDTWSGPQRLRAVMELQRRAAALTIEVEQRKELERALRRALSARRAAERGVTGLQADAATAWDTLRQHEQATTEWLIEAVHGMRTPLNAILGWTQMVNLTQGDQATMRQAIEVIERNAEAVNRLVDGLLEPRRGAVAPDA